MNEIRTQEDARVFMNQFVGLRSSLIAQLSIGLNMDNLGKTRGAPYDIDLTISVKIPELEYTLHELHMIFVDVVHIDILKRRTFSLFRIFEAGLAFHDNELYFAVNSDVHEAKDYIGEARQNQKLLIVSKSARWQLGNAIPYDRVIP